MSVTEEAQPVQLVLPVEPATPLHDVDVAAAIDHVDVAAPFDDVGVAARIDDVAYTEVPINFVIARYAHKGHQLWF